MTSCILDMDGLKASLVLFSVLDDTDPASVPSACDHNNIPHIEFNEISDLVAFKVQLDGVIGLD